MKNTIILNLHDTVEFYRIEKYESGIIQLLINTEERWIDFHQYNNNRYLINETELIIDELKIPSKHVCTSIQNKDQISFYWIPIVLITNNKKIKELHGNTK